MENDLLIIRRPRGDIPGKRAAWGRILDCFAQSQLTPVEFCRQHGICLKHFYVWRVKLRRQTEPGQPSFVRLIPAHNTLCVPVGGLGGSHCLEIQLGVAHLRLEFNGEMDQLARLLKAIREAVC